MTTKTKTVPTGIDALVGTKTRKWTPGDPSEPPYLTLTGPGGWTWHVLKRYGKSDKDFARWFLATSSPYTYGGFELGDGYVRDVVLHAALSRVDGEVPWAKDYALIEALRDAHRSRPDPMAALGF